MSLQRLLVYSPLAALVAACLAVRVASEQTARRHDSPAPVQTPSSLGLQIPRGVETSAMGGVKNLPPAPNAQPPVDVPGLSGLEKTKAASLTTTSPEANPPKQLSKADTKYLTRVSEETPLQKRTSQKMAPQTPLRKPESWTPPQNYGPPLPPDRVYVQKQAHQLRKDLQAGRITLVVDTRDGQQLERLERSGIFAWPAPPANVVVRSERQRSVLAGTTEDSDLLPPAQSRLQLASRGGELERTAPNPADDPDFDPCAVPPSPLLMRMLTTLAGHSTSAHPLEILSLLRPPYRVGGYVHVGPANPHSMGLAADIGAYGGHVIRQSDPEGCVTATLALLRDLPPGRYRLGMPKAPEGGWDLPPALIALLNEPGQTASAKPVSEISRLSGRSKAAAATPTPGCAEDEPEENATACAISALYGLYASSAKPVWPFFPPPFTQIVAEDAAKEDESGNESASSAALKPIAAHGESSFGHRGISGAKSTRTVLRFQNESYAPEADLTDVRLRKALEQARKRGVDVVAMFPDGADHIHVDVRQNP